MAFDDSRLRGEISEVFITQSRFAIAMEWAERTLSLKMNGVSTYMAGWQGCGWERIGSEYLLIENYNLKLNLEKKEV